MVLYFRNWPKAAIPERLLSHRCWGLSGRKPEGSRLYEYTPQLSPGRPLSLFLRISEAAIVHTGIRANAPQLGRTVNAVNAP
jgi:hypothetical protein